VSPLAPGVLKDQQLTQSCSPGPGRAPVQPAFVCGDHAVNTSQPTYQPLSPGTAVTRQLPPLTNKTIGDELTGSESAGNSHLVELLTAIQSSGCAKDTMVVVTYDEFGGQWDHVSPPGQGNNNNSPHDIWGPGSRIPALVLVPHLHGDFVVDSAEHDTPSIDATIEHRFGLKALSSRDAAVNDLATVFQSHKPQT
jgi:phospholipase C